MSNCSVPFQPQSSHGPLVWGTDYEDKSKNEIDALLQVIAWMLTQKLKVDLGNIFNKYAEFRSSKVYD